MSDLLINAAVSGGLSAGYLLMEYLLQQRMQLLSMKPVLEAVPPDAATTMLIPDLREALEDFIRRKPYDTAGREGIEFEHEALVESEVERHAGIVNRDIFVTEIEKPQEYRFIINYTSACQQGMEIVQPYITLLTKALAYAITELGHPVAINALGKDFIVVKRFQDHLDGNAVDRVKVASCLNLYHGLEAAIELAEQESLQQTVSFYVVNGSGLIRDEGYQVQVEHSISSRAYAYQIGKPGPDAELLSLGDFVPQWASSLPPGYANSYFVESVAGLKNTFVEFVRQAKQHR